MSNQYLSSHKGLTIGMLARSRLALAWHRPVHPPIDPLVGPEGVPLVEPNIESPDGPALEPMVDSTGQPRVELWDERVVHQPAHL